MMFWEHTMLIPIAPLPKWAAVPENSFLTSIVLNFPIQPPYLPDAMYSSLHLC